MVGNRSNELPFTAAILDMDAKNYHAWSHRQWAVRTFALWDGELEFTNGMLMEDFRNNSAWNHRWFTITRGDNGAALERGLVEAEMDLAYSYASRAPQNEAVCNYLRALGKKHPLGLAAPPAVRFLDLVDWARLGDRSVRVERAALLSVSVDILDAAGRRQEAINVCDRLVGGDAVRAEYWRWRKQLLSQTNAS